MALKNNLVTPPHQLSAKTVTTSQTVASGKNTETIDSSDVTTPTSLNQMGHVTSVPHVDGIIIV